MNIFSGSEPDWENFKGWHFDLKLGNEVFITGRNKPLSLKKNEYLTIKPGEFALLLTEETINMPSNLMAFIAVRFSYKKKGLLNISGFHVDPCYKGKLIFSVYNAGPNDILMQKGKPVFMIFFCEINHDLIKFQESLLDPDNKCKLPQKLIDEVKNKEIDYSKRNGYKHIPLEMMTAIQGSSVSLIQNNNRIEKLESFIKIYGSITIGLIIALVGIIIAQAL